MVRHQERGVIYHLSDVYDFRPTELIEVGTHFSAFAQPHVINGHKIMCILTRSSRQTVSVNLDSDTPGVSSEQSVLFLDAREASGMSVNESLKIDGRLYRITSIRQPVNSVVRLELLGHAG